MTVCGAAVASGGLLGQRSGPAAGGCPVHLRIVLRKWETRQTDQPPLVVRDGLQQRQRREGWQWRTKRHGTNTPTPLILPHEGPPRPHTHTHTLGGAGGGKVVPLLLQLSSICDGSTGMASVCWGHVEQTG